MQNLIKNWASGGGVVLLDTTEYSPYSSFSISLDTTPYAGFLIYTRGRAKSGKPTNIQFVPKGATGLYVFAFGRDGNNGCFTGVRTCTITDTSIDFTSPTYAGSDCTIMRIYGVKTSEDVNYYEPY